MLKAIDRARRVCLLLIVVAVLFSLELAVTAPHALASPASQSGQPVVIYFFWGDGCPHCAAAKPFLADLTQRYPNTSIRAFEVWNSTSNQQLFIRMATAYGFEPSAVPTIFIGDRYWVGYAEPIAREIEAAVALCTTSGCSDAGAGIVPGAALTVSATPTPTATAESADPLTTTESAQPLPAEPAAAAPETPRTIDVPFLGAVDLATQSLGIGTALIAFVDGFNPCSVWVLTMLLALTLHTGSRRKVLLVGLVFLTVTSLVYALFITGLFTMFSVIRFVGWIQVVVALTALFFGVVNIKDYFWYKQGFSFTIADEQKPGIYRSMRRVLNAGESTWGLIGATVVLAAGVSLVEFSCTAGFPVLWTNLLISQQVTAVTFGALLLLYMLIYQLDELGIFLVAVFTLRASKLEEKQGRILKLIGGVLMVTLAVVMVVNPTWMSQISSSLWVFAAAFGAAVLILVVHRWLLPAWGIHIGSEFTATPTSTKRTAHGKASGHARHH